MPTINRRRFMQAVALSGGGLRLMPVEAAENDSSTIGNPMLTPAAQQTIERGLVFLAGRQNQDGSFGVGGYSQNVAVCALAGMAFLSAGSTPDRGPYGPHVTRCVDYLLKHTSDSGFIVMAAASSHGPMYGHGFATLFLAQAYGMIRRPELREKLTRAVRLIVNTQNAEGGWRYQPQRRDADLSVTICQVMALRAARNVGIHVPNETIDRCISYVKRSQNPDGGFRYLLASGPSAFPRSAAGVVALYSAGVYQGPEIQRGLQYLMPFLPRPDETDPDGHFFYGHYYAVQAMWHAGGDYWQRWYPAIRDDLIRRQGSDGTWVNSICPEYGAAMALIILQIPNDCLPISQR